MKEEKKPKYDERKGAKHYFKEVSKFIEKKSSKFPMLFSYVAQKLLELSDIKGINTDGLSFKYLNLKSGGNLSTSQGLIRKFTDYVMYEVMDVLSLTGYDKLGVKLEQQHTLESQFGKVVLAHINRSGTSKVSHLKLHVRFFFVHST
jgi:hypothetical protein